MPNLSLYHQQDLQGWTRYVFENVNYNRSDLTEADYILYPNTFISNSHKENIVWLKNLKIESARHGKPYVAFLHDDPDKYMKVTKGLLFRTSLLNSRAGENEYTLPSFLKEYDAFPPVDEFGIGFCGSMNKIRQIALDKIDKSGINRRIIRRDYFHLNYDSSQQEKNEKEFMDNMKYCPYQLCVRGRGNFSHRFYEAMMLGRIPVVLNTDLRFPRHEEIDWNEYIVISNSPKKLVFDLLKWNAHHNLIRSQYNCRKLWEEYLSPAGFGKYVERILIKRLNEF